MELRVDRSLSDIVQHVKAAGYSESHQLQVQPRTLESTTWRMYVKRGENCLLRIAYVSDASDLVTRETFTEGDLENDTVEQQEHVLEEMLSNYVEGKKAVDHNDKQGWKQTGYAAATGAVVGFVIGRIPEAVMGGALAALAWQLPRGYRVWREEHKLDTYLTSHNIKTGGAAWTALASEHRRMP